MTEQERSLVEAAKAGDQEAFAQLVARHEKRVYTLALRMLSNPHDAEDAAQEAFLSAWRGLKGFQMESSFSTWLYRLAANQCIDVLRREKRRVRAVSMDEDGETGVFQVPDPAPGPQEQAEAGELRERLRRCMAALSREHRQILTLREVGGLSYEEIGQALSLEPGTVKSRMARARLRLKELMEKEGNLSSLSSSKKAEGR